jgi:hypothetical protein
VGESLHTAAKPRLDGLKHSADITPLSGLGNHRTIRITVSTISTALGISEPYATDIRAGKRKPHPRHWLTLARLVGVSPDQERIT